jgi:tetratricopeptide (TPR) repeat protein
VQLHLRLADVFLHQLGDPAGAQRELAAARALSPDEPAVHEMTAAILVASDPVAAIAAWREVARLAEASDDHRTCARAWARLGDLHAGGGAPGDPPTAAADAWRRSLELDPLQADALVGLASAAAARNDHAIAADLYERLRGLGLAQPVAARHELALARSLVALGRTEEARTGLRRATLAGGETAAEAHACPPRSPTPLDRARCRRARYRGSQRWSSSRPATTRPRIAVHASRELAVARAMLFDKTRQSVAAADWQRAHGSPRWHSRSRATRRARCSRAGDDVAQRR